jgi:hypothetical protein
MWSFHWWLSVVVVGVTIHLLAAYLKPRLDRFGNWISQKSSARTRARRQALLEAIELLRRDRAARYAAHFEEMRYRLRGLQHFVMAGWFFACGAVLAITSKPRPSEPPILEYVSIGVTVIAIVYVMVGFDNLVEAYGLQTNLDETYRNHVEPVSVSKTSPEPTA